MVLAAGGVREWKMEQERAAALSGAQTAVLAETLTETEAESLPQIRTEAESQPQQLQEKKKIALTFDDDVIIGLSQEISYKEAVSMI